MRMKWYIVPLGLLAGGAVILLHGVVALVAVLFITFCFEAMFYILKSSQFGCDKLLLISRKVMQFHIICFMATFIMAAISGKINGFYLYSFGEGILVYQPPFLWYLLVSAVVIRYFLQMLYESNLNPRN